MTNLTYLSCTGVIDDGWLFLTNLSHLHISQGFSFQDENLVNLKMLTKLEVYAYSRLPISDNTLQQLTNLVEINLDYSTSEITIESLSKLTNLTSIALDRNSLCLFDGLVQLPKLSTLCMRDNDEFDSTCLLKLSHHKSLKINNFKPQKKFNFLKLTSLTTLTTLNSVFES